MIILNTIIFILAGIFALYPLIHQLLSIYYTKKNNAFKDFKKTWTCFYLDWLFIPFNFFFVLSGPYNVLNAVLLLMLGFVFSFALHLFWINKAKKNSYLFDYKGFSTAGKLHLIFFAVESSFIMIFLTNLNNSFFYIIGLLILIIFNSLMVYGSYKTHKKPLKTDIIGSLILFIAIIIRILI